MAGSDLLAELEHLVLLAVLHLGEDGYGMSVRREIEARTGRDVAIGAVYAALERLERDGLVSARLGEPSAHRGGRAKRHFRLEPAGLHLLREARARLEAMSRGLEREVELDPHRSHA